MSRRFVRTSAIAAASAAQPSDTSTAPAHERPSPSESTVAAQRGRGQVLGHAFEVDARQDAEKHPADRLEDEHPEEHAHERADLGVHGAADRGAEDSGDHGGDESPPRAFAPLARLDRHIEHAEPDHGRDDGDDESSV